jgi:hypothetical protein
MQPEAPYIRSDLIREVVNRRQTTIGTTGKAGTMQTALLRQWQTAALLLLVLGFALSALSLPNHVLSLLPIDWLVLAAPFGAGVVGMHLGRYRLAALCGVMGACAGALLFWSMLFAAVSGLIVAGLTVSTLEAGMLAGLMIGVTGTMSGTVGSLWRLPDAPRRPALDRRANNRRTIGVGLKN